MGNEPPERGWGGGETRPEAEEGEGECRQDHEAHHEAGREVRKLSSEESAFSQPHGSGARVPWGGHPSGLTPGRRTDS